MNEVLKPYFDAFGIIFPKDKKVSNEEQQEGSIEDINEHEETKD